MKLKQMVCATFDGDELRAVGDEEILEDPEALHDVVVMHALWLANGRDVKGTQLDRIVRKAQERGIIE